MNFSDSLPPESLDFGDWVDPTRTSDAGGSPTPSKTQHHQETPSSSTLSPSSPSQDPASVRRNDRLNAINRAVEIFSQLIFDLDHGYQDIDLFQYGSVNEIKRIKEQLITLAFELEAEEEAVITNNQHAVPFEAQQQISVSTAPLPVRTDFSVNAVDDIIDNHLWRLRKHVEWKIYWYPGSRKDFRNPANAWVLTEDKDMLFALPMAFVALFCTVAKSAIHHNTAANTCAGDISVILKALGVSDIFENYGTVYITTWRVSGMAENTKEKLRNNRSTLFETFRRCCAIHDLAKNLSIDEYGNLDRSEVSQHMRQLSLPQLEDICGLPREGWGMGGAYAADYYR